MQEYLSNIKNLYAHYSRKKWFIFVLVSGFLVSLGILLFLIVFDNSAGNFSNYSKVNLSESRTYFNINSETGYLYKGQGEGLDAVKDFIKKGGPLKGYGNTLPEDFIDNSSLSKSTKDSEINPNYVSNSSSKEHYSFKQTINGIEVYGASLIVHLQNKNEIYSTSGNITTDKNTTKTDFSDTAAVEVAAARAREESGIQELEISEAKKMILNFKVLGLSDDPVNYLTMAVTVDSSEVLFSKRYFVELEHGKIIYDEDLIREAKQRNVYDCGGNSNPTNCPIAKSENSQNPTGVQEVEDLFEYMGEIYDYYKTNFNRDGLDGKGSALEGFTRIYSYAISASSSRLCSQQTNAYHSIKGYMAYCPGAVARDITAHEFGHGVVGATVGLAPGYQYGALNESMGDAFARALDGNWTMGEGSFLGVIRNMANPPSVRNQPDRLFSQNYDCTSEEVHHNDGIPNKAFYLMTDGGDFNGCSISGLGIERSQQILYKVLASQYIPSTANFYDLYSGVSQACADLYGSGSLECEEAKKAYQATEMDQQPAGSARGASCVGISAKPATCSGSPTTGPLPTVAGLPTSTPTPPQGATSTPTLPPGTTATPTPTTSPVTGSATATPTPAGGIFKPEGTPTPTPEQYFSCAPDPKCISNGKSIQLCPLVCTPK